jgi:ribulose kinase
MAYQSCAIGTDLGTTSVEAIAFDASMHEMSSAAQHLESRHDDAEAKDTSVSPLLTKHFLVNSGMKWENI